jgi:cyclic beta-1,2-glucan synthetase
VESLLGLTRTGDRLAITPCLPDDWTGFAMQYRYVDTTYRITVRTALASDARARVALDGVEQARAEIVLVNDLLPHLVEITLPAQPVASVESGAAA